MLDVCSTIVFVVGSLVWLTMVAEECLKDQLTSLFYFNNANRYLNL